MLLGRIAPFLNGIGDALIVQFGGFACSKSAKGIVGSVVWTSIVAHLWRERCSCTHGGVPMSVDVLARRILVEINYQALGDAAFSSAVSSLGFSLQL
ncbi:hypothetical protein LINPERHAP2_LOCUS39549 [Linum perenne]